MDEDGAGRQACDEPEAVDEMRRRNEHLERLVRERSTQLDRANAKVNSQTAKVQASTSCFETLARITSDLVYRISPWGDFEFLNEAVARLGCAPAAQANAAKHARGEEKGDIIISTPANDGNVVIAVEDTGVGIAPEHWDRVFDPFFTTKEVGTGQGLAITHSVVQKYGGSITFTSEPGQGTTFVVSFPVGEMPGGVRPEP